MFWKIYFVFIILLSIPLYLGGASGHSYEMAVDLGSLIIGLISLFGLAWKKKILSKMFWKIYFPLSVVWNLGHAYVTFDGIITVVFTAIYLPTLIGTFLYAYRSSEMAGQE